MDELIQFVYDYVKEKREEDNEESEGKAGAAKNWSVPQGTFIAGSRKRGGSSSKSAGKGFRLYNKQELCTLLSMYCVARDLTDPKDKKFVMVDALLADTLYRGKKMKDGIPQRLPKAAAAMTMLERCTVSYALPLPGKLGPFTLGVICITFCYSRGMSCDSLTLTRSAWLPGICSRSKWR